MKTKLVAGLLALACVVAPQPAGAQTFEPYTLCNPAQEFLAGGDACTTIHELFWRYVSTAWDGLFQSHYYTASVRYTNVFPIPVTGLRLRWRETSPYLESGELALTGAGYHEADFGSAAGWAVRVPEGGSPPPPPEQPFPISFEIFGFNSNITGFPNPPFGPEYTYWAHCDDTDNAYDACQSGPLAPDPLNPPATVPEPMTVLLLGTGLLGVCGVGLVRKRRQVGR